MENNVVSFVVCPPVSLDWTNQELAEFYRVEASLMRAGVGIDSDRGVSDIGEPWFVFCNIITDEVLVHFARIDSQYLVASAFLESAVRGADFRALVQELLDRHPVIVASGKRSTKLVLHPAALLLALVTTCFFKLGHGDASASEIANRPLILQKEGNHTLSHEETATALNGVLVDQHASTALIGAIEAASVSVGLEPPVSYVSANLWLSNIALSGLVSSHEGDQFAMLSAAISGFDLSPAVEKPEHVVHLSAAGGDQSSLFLYRSVDIDLILVHHSQDMKAHDSVNTLVETQRLSGTSADYSLQSGLPAIFNREQLPLALHQDTTIGAPMALALPSFAAREVSMVSADALVSHYVFDRGKPSSIPVISAISAQIELAAAPTVPASRSPLTTESLVFQQSYPSANVVETAVQKFMMYHPDYQIFDHNGELVIFDSHLTVANLPMAEQQEFMFRDGSSILLIGIPHGG